MPAAYVIKRHTIRFAAFRVAGTHRAETSAVNGSTTRQLEVKMEVASEHDQENQRATRQGTSSIQESDTRLRKKTESIRVVDYVYFTVGLKNHSDHKHKFAPVAEGLFKVINSGTNAETIEKADRSVKTALCLRVLLAPCLCPERKTTTRLLPIR